MSEWKDLKIDNLPPDILAGDYEWEWTNPDWCLCELTVIDILGRLKLSGESEYYRYRKPQPKAPSHEEIMSKWWKSEKCWYKVIAWNPENDTFAFVYNDWFNRSYFTGRQSATIPPEAE